MKIIIDEYKFSPGILNTLCSILTILLIKNIHNLDVNIFFRRRPITFICHSYSCLVCNEILIERFNGGNWCTFVFSFINDKESDKPV